MSKSSLLMRNPEASCLQMVRRWGEGQQKKLHWSCFLRQKDLLSEYEKENGGSTSDCAHSEEAPRRRE